MNTMKQIFKKNQEIDTPWATMHKMETCDLCLCVCVCVCSVCVLCVCVCVLCMCVCFIVCVCVCVCFIVCVCVCVCGPCIKFQMSRKMRRS